MKNRIVYIIIYGVFLNALVISDSRIVLGQELVPVNKEQIALSFAPLVRKATPAVVNIYTKKIVRARRAVPLFDDPFFRHFFGNKFGMQFSEPQSQSTSCLKMQSVLNLS